MKKLLIFIVLIFAVGCTSRYMGTVTLSSVTLDLEANQNMLIVIPNDGATRKGAINKDSGMLTAEILSEEFGKYNNLIKLSMLDTTGLSDDLVAEAVAAGARYIIIPKILCWEHRLTFISNRSSYVEASIVIYDVQKSKVVMDREISAKGRKVFTLGMKPAKLLQESVRQFVDGLYNQ